ncbi:MAG: hypothetical protein GC162_18840 [Planctomycetes bacterium]|nr:hypothetical protein [Planctomycetota bacterium]
MTRLLACGMMLIAVAVRAADHPIVAGFERFDAAAVDDASRIAGGELLLGELNCIACHRANDEIRERLSVKAAPDLKQVGHRLAAADIARFVIDPQAFKYGTTMPLLLDASRDAATASNIAAFLAGAAKPEDGDTRNVWPERGRQLFVTIGCVACHQRPDGVSDDDFAVPLELGRHYGHKALVDFLMDPLSIRPGGRMPGMKLDRTDAADIAAWIKSTVAPAGAPAVKSTNVDSGRQAFTKLGCVACHDLGHGLLAPPAAKPLADLDPAAKSGCLAQHPTAPAADFSLSSAQRTALAVAINALKKPLVPLAAAARVHRMMTRFNCYACHHRGDIGGPAIDRQPLFTGEDEIGNEGRFPPALTDIGRHLQKAWMHDVLAGKAEVRPYLNTRMPMFGFDNVGAFVDLTFEADGGSAADPAMAFKDGDVEAGRTLLGARGLMCITCHQLRDRKALGIQALNLSTIPRRLQPDYFRRALIEPQVLRPGTLMPIFFPEGHSTRPDILGGDADKQIASIWKYLAEGKNEPEGYPPKQGDFELLPTDKAMLLRCFMKDVGADAIAVGFPEKVHFAFDATHVRPALAWRGRFVDAYSTWFTRFQEPTAPLGDDVIALPTDSAFVDANGKTLPLNWQGYRLDKYGIPTFLYTAGPYHIEDRISARFDARGLRRTIRGDFPNNSVHFNPGSAKGVTIKKLQIITGSSFDMEYRW